MASPFYLFRKYQKAFLVVAGVMAMFIFVLADPLTAWLQSNSGGGGANRGNAVVTTWDGGSINAQQLALLTQRRYKINGFLQSLYGRAVGLIQQEGGTPVPPALPNLILNPNDPRNTTRGVQIGCVDTRFFASLAEASGMTISDDIVNNYIREWGLNRIGDAEIGIMLNQLELSERELFAGLRELLLRSYYLNSYEPAILGVTPRERWVDWKRINERITVQATILPTQTFLAEVPEPSEADLRSFYEEYKERAGNVIENVSNTPLPSPLPGFREPRRVKLQYLTGNLQDWTAKMLDQVTDEEIAEYYERNKQTLFVKTTAKRSTSIEGLFDDEGKDAETSESAADNAPESEVDTTDTDATNEEQSDSEKADGEKSSQTNRRSPFRLAAFQTETAPEEKAETEETAAAQEPEDTEETTSEDADSDEDAEEEKPVEYEPLEEVADQIRRSIANTKAEQELQKIIDDTYLSLQTAYTPYGADVVQAREKEEEIPTPPAELTDFVAIAKKTGLVSEETALLSLIELSETFVGKAVDADSNRITVAYQMSVGHENYDPYLAIDDGNVYIVSKVEDIPSRIPEFEEVRDAVLAAWKKQEAAKLALAKAEELAKQAGESGDTVAAVAQDYETVTTDMFSWLSFGTTRSEMQRGPRLSEAPPLKNVDEEFMTEVFQLEPEKRIALLNHDHTSALVVQLASRELTRDEMRKQFIAEANTWFGRDIMMEARQKKAVRLFQEQLRQKANFDFKQLNKFFNYSEQ